MCSYCGCRSNTEIARYSREHEAILDAFGFLRRAAESGTDAEMRQHAEKVGELLHPHSQREERSLFAELRLQDEFTEHIDGLCAEHGAIDALIDRAAACERDVIPELYEALWRHIDKEENGLFPAAIIALDGPAWTRVVALAADESPAHTH